MLFDMLGKSSVPKEKFDEYNENQHEGVGIDGDNLQESATVYDLLCQHIEGEGLQDLKSSQVKCEGFRCWN